MTPDDFVTLATQAGIVFTVLCAFCAWLHIKAASE